MPRHPQKAFVTRDGVCTTVDSQLLRTLCLLRAHKVETLYSCQGGVEEYDPRAYVLVRGRTALKLLWRIHRLNRAERLSESSRGVIRMFRKGYFVLEFGIFGDAGQEHHRFRYLKKTKFERNTVEVLLSRHYGFRICFRWPEEHTDRIEMLLSELH